MGSVARLGTRRVLALTLLAAGAPVFGQGVLNVSVASIPSTATRVVAIADGTAVSSPVYAIQSVTPPAGSAALSMSLPGGTYRVRVLADGASRTLVASAQMSIQVPDGNATKAFIALAPVSVTVDSSTPSTAKAGSPVTIVFDITDWGDVLESANAELFTSTSAFSVATGGVLAASATPVKVASGSYTVSFSVTPAIGSASLTYVLRASIPIGSPDCPYLYSPDPATSPSQPWRMSVVAQAGAAVTVSGIPSNCSRLVVVADVQPAPPFYAQRAVTLGTASATAFIALPANTYRIRILADSPAAGMLASGQTTVTVSSGATATASVALTAMSVTVDASTPATAAAASSVAILFDIVDAGNVLSGVYAYLWAGLGPFGVAGGGTIVGVAGFSTGSTTVQAGFSILMPAGVATFNYVLRAQVWTGVDYSLLVSPNPAQSPNSPWQVQTVVTTGISLSVTNIPSAGVRLVVLADGPLPTVVSSEQAVSAGATSATILVAVPAGTYRLRALVDASAGDIIATGQVGGVAPAAGTGSASVALSPPVVTLGASTPASAQAGAVVMLGFNMADAGDVLENANAYLYTGTAPFNLVTGGFLLGVYPLTKASPGQYRVSFSDTAPPTASTLYFEVRVQVATGLTPSFLDSPDPTASSLPWSMAISLPGTQPCTPAAAFRDTSGSIRLIYYGTTTVQFLGGQLAGDPVVDQSPGCVVYVAARDNYNLVWMAIFDPIARTATWKYAGGPGIQGQPSIAVARSGVVYISVRDTNGSYWLAGYTPGVGFGPWIFIGGLLASDPALAASPDGSIYMIGRDTYNAVWSAWYVPGSGFQGWKSEPGTIQGMPAVTVGTDDYAYIAIRDAYNGLWTGRLEGKNWMGWNYVGGVLNSDPKVAASGDGTIYVAMLDQWNGVWYRARAEGASGAWQPWTYGCGTLQTLSPAATPGQLYLAGRDSSNALWWFRSTTGLWSAAGGNGLTTGALAAAPH
jgi:hypothetical protein